MHIKSLSTKLLAEFNNEPQKAKIIELALREIETVLVRLYPLGLFFHLEEGLSMAKPDWPQVFYHAEKNRGGRLTFCQEDFEELGPGWCKTLEDADHAAGLAKQFHGRGGVKSQNLPAVILSKEEEEAVYGLTLGQRLRKERQEAQRLLEEALSEQGLP